MVAELQNLIELMWNNLLFRKNVLYKKHWVDKKCSIITWDIVVANSKVKCKRFLVQGEWNAPLFIATYSI